ncbi:MAG: imidazoleglycerol-phosphate dehydratase HisB [Desulfocucumaceae bacterium]
MLSNKNERKAYYERKTNETEIKLSLNLDGQGMVKADTGIGFFNHMLDLLGRHAGFDLDFEVRGDLEVDAHHTIEDVGISLGRAIKEALGEKRGINRYGHILLPMDEALVLVALDLSGRGFLGLEADFQSTKVGQMDTELVEEFLSSLAINGEITLHVRVLAGKNTHHIIEAIFKGLARSLKMAVARGTGEEVPSTKGVL